MAAFVLMMDRYLRVIVTQTAASQPDLETNMEDRLDILRGDLRDEADAVHAGYPRKDCFRADCLDDTAI